jgi:hypothetical protein
LRARGGTNCGNPETTTAVLLLQNDPIYEGKPLSYWIKILRSRDEGMPLALEAIQSLGPLAWRAVPILEEIVADAFMPVKVGEDKNDVILSKLVEIQLRADTIDALAAIGPAAECSTKSLIRWALTVRVIPANIETAKTRSLFAELVGVDTLERMRVAAAVPELGRGALETAAVLLASKNGEEQKFAVAILAEKTLPIATGLLKSPDCEDRKLGLAILADMWPVVPETHLHDLKDTVVCGAN